VPLYRGYAVNCQQLQGITITDPTLYLLGDIINCDWLQGLAAVLVTRTTDIGRLMLRTPPPQQEWLRSGRRSWFRVDSTVQAWLQQCRATGRATVHAVVMGMAGLQQRRARVLTRLQSLRGLRLDALAACSAEMVARGAEVAAATTMQLAVPLILPAGVDAAGGA